MSTLIKSDREICELAYLLIERYGLRAATYARYQSLNAARHNQKHIMETWRRIANAADQVWRLEPA